MPKTVCAWECHVLVQVFPRKGKLFDKVPTRRLNQLPTLTGTRQSKTDSFFVREEVDSLHFSAQQLYSSGLRGAIDTSFRNAFEAGCCAREGGVARISAHCVSGGSREGALPEKNMDFMWVPSCRPGLSVPERHTEKRKRML